MTFVIAEIGVNHNGSVGIAKRMIDVAVNCGADAVKFQTFDSDLLEPPGERRDMLKNLQLNYVEFAELKEYCGNRIEFMSTAFDVQSLEFLVKLGIKRIKISSGQITHKDILAYAEGCGLPVIVSTGMAGDREIDGALRALKYAQSVTLLQCTSAYPAPVEDVNLRAMVAMGRSYGCPIGLSDHTLSTVIPAAAVALGATVIEKHLTLDRSDKGPDHAMSTEPFDFRRMVFGVRHVAVAMGKAEKSVAPSESEVVQIVERRNAWKKERQTK